ncbi:hypothetical protein ACWN8V_07680 [Vagococcus elongatus]|uniref:Uncharacterized protein n=1 Tax=Vagococcus elongatus TaxID=180344 RepID=A0A430AU28_9ENTE|nr:hypothetical protein [Vagococcus elongatus]RSU11562.1 hypothetical protein CBF29_07730 [Vagococcus elongatus]
MDFKKFCEELLESQKNKRLSDYCLKHWHGALLVLGEVTLKMDQLVEIAQAIVNNELLEDEYWQLVKKFISEYEST